MDPTDKKYKQACEDLKLLTGLEFTFAQVKTSSGPLWVFRTLTPATYVPDYDLLMMTKGVSPLNITDSETFARHTGRQLNWHFEQQCGIGRFVPANDGARIDAVEVKDFLGIRQGSFKAAVDFSAETKGRYNEIDLKALHKAADEARATTGTWAKLRKVKPYAAPKFGELFMQETTEEMVKEIAARKTQWEERMLGLKKDPPPNFVMLDSKKIALEGLEREKNLGNEPGLGPSIVTPN